MVGSDATSVRVVPQAQLTNVQSSRRAGDKKNDEVRVTEVALAGVRTASFGLLPSFSHFSLAREFNSALAGYVRSR
jgi:hypothetical protein